MPATARTLNHPRKRQETPKNVDLCVTGKNHRHQIRTI
jgi:hypothetical protein